jgi:hypothetical protein
MARPCNTATVAKKVGRVSISDGTECKLISLHNHRYQSRWGRVRMHHLFKGIRLLNRSLRFLSCRWLSRPWPFTQVCLVSIRDWRECGWRIPTGSGVCGMQRVVGLNAQASWEGVKKKLTRCRLEDGPESLVEHPHSCYHTTCGVQEKERLVFQSYRNCARKPIRSILTIDESCHDIECGCCSQSKCRNMF